MTQVKQQKGWRMSCDVGKATEGLENELTGGRMRQVLQRGLLQGQEPVGVAGLWGQRLVSTIS